MQFYLIIPDFHFFGHNQLVTATNQFSLVICSPVRLFGFGNKP